ncbi:MAG: SCO family protein [Methyloligella sp. ZOD6]
MSLAAGLGLAVLLWSTGITGEIFGSGADSVLQPFDLTASDGRQVTEADLEGKPFAIFFGFTHCPDVCPTTLFEISQSIEALGAAAGEMGFYFVTVDPERDTEEALKAYLSNFDSHIVGLTGNPRQTAALADAFHVYHKKVESGSGYSFDHTNTVFLVNERGEIFSTIAYQEDGKTRLKKLERLLALSG